MATSTVLTNKPINPRGDDNRPVDSYNRASLYSGKALDFDGVNDSVTTGSNLGNLQTLSVAMHCRIDNMTDGTARGVVSQWDSSDGWMIYKSSVSSKLAFWKNGGVVFTWDDSLNYSDQWIHLVYVIEQGVGNYVYANGVLVGSDTTGIADIDYTNNPTLKVGVYGNIPTGYFNGAVNDVKVFSTALTASQVSDLYNNPEKIVPTGVSNTALKLWLPMMEGAGTTAYDGSGNGNHGTISGATWTHGIGAPVAQTAVIDWNKGTNLFNSSDWEVSNATTNASISSSSQSAPNGIDTAAVFDDGTGSTYKRGYKVSNTGMAIGQITAGTFVKKKDVDYINVVLGTDGGSTKIFALVDLVNGTINATSGSPTATSIQSVGDGWYYVSVQGTQTTTAQGITYIYGQDPTNGSSVDENYTGANNETYIWGINIQEGSINNVHLPTIGALQNSPVLLPQGLTSGRDITGVNLFENVRKQGALNLDGNSWAEVHDNASVDLTTEATFEAWVNNKTGELSSNNRYMPIFDKATGLNGTNGFTLRVYSSYSANGGYFAVGGAYVLFNFTDGSYQHIMVTLEANSQKIYINGALQNTYTNAWTITQNGETLKIGYAPSDGQQWLNGSIAQPRIYNRALTASEVLNNYNATKTQFQ